MEDEQNEQIDSEDKTDSEGSNDWHQDSEHETNSDDGNNRPRESRLSRMGNFSRYLWRRTLGSGNETDQNNEGVTQTAGYGNRGVHVVGGIDTMAICNKGFLRLNTGNRQKATSSWSMGRLHTNRIVTNEDGHTTVKVDEGSDERMEIGFDDDGDRPIIPIPNSDDDEKQQVADNDHEQGGRRSGVQVEQPSEGEIVEEEKRTDQEDDRDHDRKAFQPREMEKK